MADEAGLKQRITDDMKAAMKSGDTLRRDTLRMLGAAIKNAEIEKRGTPLAEADVVALVAREIKHRQESIEAFTAGKRPDLIAKEEAEKKVLEAYMPAQMDRAGIEDLIRKVMDSVGATGPADKGKLMKELMPQVRGKADGKLVNDIVTELLNR